MKLLLDIDPTADPVNGTVSDEHGASEPFTSWTQLGAILDRAISGAARRPGVPHVKPGAAEAKRC